MLPRHKRFLTIGVVVAVLALALGLTLRALQTKVTFFFTPTEIAAKLQPDGRDIRVGGLVKTGSIKRSGLTIEFVITDTEQDLTVRYTGIVPDLFREGQGVVATGRMGNANIFNATTLLAKHDENYMPPEVAKALKKNKGAAP